MLATAGWGLSAVASLLPLMFSVMLFDAPGSENNPWLIALAGGLASFPVLCVVSIAASWIIWVVTRNWPAERATTGRWLRVGAALLPLLSMLVMVIAVVGLQVRCSGDFRCGG